MKNILNIVVFHNSALFFLEFHHLTDLHNEQKMLVAG
jgi:hypothetical protein